MGQDSGTMHRKDERDGRRAPATTSGRLILLLLAVATGVPSAPAGELTAAEKHIVAAVDRGREAAIDLLRRSVDISSASQNAAGVDRVGELFAAELRSLGFSARRVDLPASMRRGGHLVAVRQGTRGQRLLLIGHLDTVVEGEPFRREGSKGYGSGASDMKGGDVVILAALRALDAAGVLAGRTVTVVMTGDEESPGQPQEESRRALVEAAKASDVALAFEGSVQGAAVVGRRGISTWRLEVEGSQGHSSGIFGDKRGSGAIFEAARILTAFHDTLREPYLTYNPGVIVGGTDVALDEVGAAGTAQGKDNVVSRAVIVHGDLRFLTPDQLARAREKMSAIAAKSLPRTKATLTYTDGYPSMAPRDAHRAVLRRLDEVSRDLGAEPIGEHDPGQRGAGDIAFVAHLIPSLDGLGAMGDQEHAPGEWIDLDSLPLLTKRAAVLMHRLAK